MVCASNRENSVYQRADAVMNLAYLREREEADEKKESARGKGGVKRESCRGK